MLFKKSHNVEIDVTFASTSLEHYVDIKMQHIGGNMLHFLFSLGASRTQRETG
ncbi:hypothetical protein VCR6J2_230532 [Vibrio coralliirubri]|nr:hypothetical protein VCR1J2_200388 [Vibrio coralliirubri]CDT16495.1 hypothetical protein VCR6J2_230532 [Vibrio coralliirubri]CDT75590.1 hypothetical protein VCR8J2_190353 [Vibrio coralliirubri]